MARATGLLFYQRRNGHITSHAHILGMFLLFPRFSLEQYSTPACSSIYRGRRDRVSRCRPLRSTTFLANGQLELAKGPARQELNGTAVTALALVTIRCRTRRMLSSDLTFTMRTPLPKHWIMDTRRQSPSLPDARRLGSELKRCGSAFNASSFQRP